MPPTVASLKIFLEGESWKILLFVVVVIPYVVCSTCMVFAILGVMRVVRPRVEPHERRTSLFLYHSINDMNLDQLRRTILDLDFDKTMDELIVQLHQMARISNAQYVSLDRAIVWMLGGGIFGIMFALVLLVSLGLT